MSPAAPRFAIGVLSSGFVMRLPGEAPRVLIINGDAPLLTGQTLRKLVDAGVRVGPDPGEHGGLVVRAPRDLHGEGVGREVQLRAQGFEVFRQLQLRPAARAALERFG